MKITHVVTALGGASLTYVVLALQAGSEPLLIPDPVAPAAAEESGTRLKAKFTLGSDGSKLFEPEVMHDTQLDVDCNFRKAADGQLRCLPLAGVASFDGWGLLFFKDDQCTQPYAAVVEAGMGCDGNPLPYMVSVIPPAACATSNNELASRVYEVGAEITVSWTPYTLNGNGDCVQAQGGPLPDPPKYDLTEVPASSFVSASPGVDL